MIEQAIKDMCKIESAMGQLNGARFGTGACPVVHTFADGLYIRQITMPAGLLIVSKLHKTTHPYFIQRGECTVQSGSEKVLIKAPHWGITKAGTKRLLFIHTETVWVTVHATQETDLEKIEAQVIAVDYGDLLEHLNKQERLP